MFDTPRGWEEASSTVETTPENSEREAESVAVPERENKSSTHVEDATVSSPSHVKSEGILKEESRSRIRSILRRRSTTILKPRTRSHMVVTRTKKSKHLQRSSSSSQLEFSSSSARKSKQSRQPGSLKGRVSPQFSPRGSPRSLRRLSLATVSEESRDLQEEKPSAHGRSGVRRSQLSISVLGRNLTAPSKSRQRRARSIQAEVMTEEKKGAQLLVDERHTHSDVATPQGSPQAMLIAQTSESVSEGNPSEGRRSPSSQNRWMMAREPQRNHRDASRLQGKFRRSSPEKTLLQAPRNEGALLKPKSRLNHSRSRSSFSTSRLGASGTRLSTGASNDVVSDQGDDASSVDHRSADRPLFSRTASEMPLPKQVNSPFRSSKSAAARVYNDRHQHGEPWRNVGAAQGQCGVEATSTDLLDTKHNSIATDGTDIKADHQLHSRTLSESSTIRVARPAARRKKGPPRSSSVSVRNGARRRHSVLSQPEPSHEFSKSVDHLVGIRQNQDRPNTRNLGLTPAATVGSISPSVDKMSPHTNCRNGRPREIDKSFRGTHGVQLRPISVSLNSSHGQERKRSSRPSSLTPAASGQRPPFQKRRPSIHEEKTPLQTRQFLSISTIKAMSPPPSSTQTQSFRKFFGRQQMNENTPPSPESRTTSFKRRSPAPSENSSEIEREFNRGRAGLSPRSAPPLAYQRSKTATPHNAHELPPSRTMQTPTQPMRMKQYSPCSARSFRESRRLQRLSISRNTMSPQSAQSSQMYSRITSAQSVEAYFTPIAEANGAAKMFPAAAKNTELQRRDHREHPLDQELPTQKDLWSSPRDLPSSYSSTVVHGEASEPIRSPPWLDVSEQPGQTEVRRHVRREHEDEDTQHQTSGSTVDEIKDGSHEDFDEGDETDDSADDAKHQRDSQYATDRALLARLWLQLMRGLRSRRVEMFASTYHALKPSPLPCLRISGTPRFSWREPRRSRSPSEEVSMVHVFQARCRLRRRSSMLDSFLYAWWLAWKACRYDRNRIERQCSKIIGWNKQFAWKRAERVLKAQKYRKNRILLKWRKVYRVLAKGRTLEEDFVKRHYSHWRQLVLERMAVVDRFESGRERRRLGVVKNIFDWWLATMRVRSFSRNATKEREARLDHYLRRRRDQTCRAIVRTWKELAREALFSWPFREARLLKRGIWGLRANVNKRHLRANVQKTAMRHWTRICLCKFRARIHKRKCRRGRMRNLWVLKGQIVRKTLDIRVSALVFIRWKARLQYIQTMRVKSVVFLASQLAKKALRKWLLISSPVRLRIVLAEKFDRKRLLKGADTDNDAQKKRNVSLSAAGFRLLSSSRAPESHVQFHEANALPSSTTATKNSPHNSKGSSSVHEAVTESAQVKSHATERSSMPRLRLKRRKKKREVSTSSLETCLDLDNCFCFHSNT
uniref:Uncharacterized protein n=1 Tax=Lotharella globosa TaxID=91324 RepID=A0A7S3YH88_9EUKA